VRVPGAQTYDGSYNRVFRIQHCFISVPTDPSEFDPAMLAYCCLTNGYLFQKCFRDNKRLSSTRDELFQLYGF
jgi:hypothetical protein